MSFRPDFQLAKIPFLRCYLGVSHQRSCLLAALWESLALHRHRHRIVAVVGTKRYNVPLIEHDEIEANWRYEAAWPRPRLAHAARGSYHCGARSVGIDQIGAGNGSRANRNLVACDVRHRFRKRSAKGSVGENPAGSQYSCRQRSRRADTASKIPSIIARYIGVCEPRLSLDGIRHGRHGMRAP